MRRRSGERIETAAGQDRHRTGLGTGLAIGMIIAWLLAVWRVGPPKGDFANYFTAATLWWEGADLTRLYDYRWFTAAAEATGFGDQLVGFPVLTPPSALLAAPLLPLGLEHALRAWQLAQAVLGLAVAAVVARSLGWPLWLGLSWLGLSWPALRAHLVQGQFHLPAVLALALAYHGWSQRKASAGLPLGLAVGLKVHAWPVVALLALVGCWRTVAWAVATLLVGGALSVALLGWPVHQLWLHQIAPAAATGWFGDPFHPSYQSFGVWVRHELWRDALLNPQARQANWWALALPKWFELAVVGATLARAAAWRSLAVTQRRRLVAAAGVAAMVSGPILSHYHLVLAIPPAAWGADALWRSGRHGRALALVLTATAMWWVQAPVVWPAHSVLGVPRLALALALWAQLVPWRGPIASGDAAAPLGGWRRPASVQLAVQISALLLVGFGVQVPRARDQAHPLWHPSQPLVAADLVRTRDGGLRMAGLKAQRSGLPGQGWMGFEVDPQTGRARAVAAVDGTHTWGPNPAWHTGPTAPIAPDAVPCLGEILSVRDDELWWGPVQLTQDDAREASPVCDPQQHRAFFLSDRLAGVDALRLWWVPLPVVVDPGDPTARPG